MLLGIIAGLTTCALWGLTFIAPRAVAPFTAWDLTIARYGIFSLACLLLMADRRFRPIGITRSRLAVISARSSVRLSSPVIPFVLASLLLPKSMSDMSRNNWGTRPQR